MPHSIQLPVQRALRRAINAGRRRSMIDACARALKSDPLPVPAALDQSCELQGYRNCGYHVVPVAADRVIVVHPRGLELVEVEDRGPGRKPAWCRG